MKLFNKKLLFILLINVLVSHKTFTMDSENSLLNSFEKLANLDETDTDQYYCEKNHIKK